MPASPPTDLFTLPDLAPGRPFALDPIPLDALTVLLVEAASAPGGWIHVADGESRAERLAALASALAPDRDILLFPPWDCLPYDRSSPSADIMGRRMAVLRRLAARPRAALVITTGDALAQRVQPPSLWQSADHGLGFALAVGEGLDVEALRVFLLAGGYTVDVHVDEPGHAALRPAVIDLFPAAQAAPLRLELAEGRIKALHRFDPLSQRTTEPLDGALLTPAGELLLPLDVVARALAAPPEEPGSFLDPATLAAEIAAGGRPRAGAEHWLPAFAPEMATLLDYLPEAALSFDAGVEDGLSLWREQIAEGFDARSRPDGDAAWHQPLPPDRLYQTAEQQAESLERRRLLRFDAEAGHALEPTPRELAEAGRAGTRLARRLREHHDAGDRLIVALRDEGEASAIRRLFGRGFPALPATVSWPEAVAATAGGIQTVLAPVAQGFSLPGLVVVGTAALLGSGGTAGATASLSAGTALFAGDALSVGDLVVHEEHGVGRVAGLASLEGEVRHDCLLVDYAGGQRLLVPVEEFNRIWRYGSEETAVALDRLKSPHWAERRAAVEAGIAETAAGLAAEARRRAALSAPALKPDAAYARFAARFPFTPTADQAAAIEAVLADLASGRPMDRLICGDVGFGKTEIALRAAAVAAFAGWQVAIIAPTTVLARQHLESFQRRFEGTKVRVAGLSRLTGGAETRAVLAGIASGDITIAVGTSALAAEKVRFARLALIVIDEEQRFGERDKARFRTLGAALIGAAAPARSTAALHTLVMTATPIPRTLQSALIGAQAFSVLATPPVRRQPVRTSVLPYDGTVLLEALHREKRRGGQSFVVCPRIEDMASLEAELHRLVPDLRCVTAHGKMKAEALDAVMTGFARGEGDILLATNIIEAGLDIPNANMMAVWRADRFGLAQLHQLRGRVGRGRRRASCHLFTEAGAAPNPRTDRRLRSLETLDRLGAGFAISARDLDQRGAGDLLGESQAGHVKLVGTELYQTLLAAAVRRAKGEIADQDGSAPDALHDRTPTLSLGLEITIPADYVPEDAARIDLFRRIARAGDAALLDDLAAEIVDRFGPLPDAVEQLLHLAQLRLQCRALGISAIEAGPLGIAATLADGPLKARVKKTPAPAGAILGRSKSGEPRLVWSEAGPAGPARLARIEEHLAQLSALSRPAAQPHRRSGEAPIGSL